jgi:hypothetical protein
MWKKDTANGLCFGANNSENKRQATDKYGCFPLAVQPYGRPRHRMYLPPVSWRYSKPPNMVSKHFYRFFLLLVFLRTGGIFSQVKQSFDYVLSPGIAYQGQPIYELNLLVGRYEEAPCWSSLAGVRIGTETTFGSGNKFLIAPKAGFEVSSMIICFRGTALTYINGRHAQLRLLPEIGISIASYANLTYGYAFAVTRSDLFDIPGHRIALSFNLGHAL